MHIGYVPADPAGNLTAFVLTPVDVAARAPLARYMMAHCREGFEQVGFVEETSLVSSLPRLDMMGGEFCGNACRAFAMLAAGRRGIHTGTIWVSISGADAPVCVELDGRSGDAYAEMPLPRGMQAIRALGREIPVVQMTGIAHAVLMNTVPSQRDAQEALKAMPPEEAQGVLFVQGTRMTPLVYVPATDTCVWESSCGSGSVALAWYLSRRFADGEHCFVFDEPGGRLAVRVKTCGGRAVSAVMGGAVSLGAQMQIDVPDGLW